MDSLRQSLLREHLHREIELAKQAEAKGDVKAAGAHYTRAGAIYRRLAPTYSGRKAKEMFDTANQYETLGSTIQNQKAVEDMKETSPQVYEEAVSSLAVSTKPDIEWESIGGLPEVKRTIKEAIILPFVKEKPPYIRAPRTILLYGPPGTGKTMLAKASSSTLNASFFEARASSLLSKYFGESGKLVNALFQKAKKMEPSVIFIDELDSVAVSRKADTNEATRRVLAEFLTQIEGFSTGKEDKILIMAATNKPWDLDDAMVSRFQRRIYVPLPDERARKSIFKIHLKGAQLSGVELEELARRTGGFSGRDIANVCQEAIMSMVRDMNPGLDGLTNSQLEHYTLKSRHLDKADFEKALESIKPSAQEGDIRKYEGWKRDFGG